VPGSGFGSGLAKLVTALNTDFDWLREHTRYLQRAIEWDTGGRPANRLLSGDDIAEAKAWVVRRPRGAPEPTALQFDFIRASEQEAAARLSEQRKQLDAMAAAQAERETALHDREEALKQRARVARVRNFALVAVSILALLAVATSALSFWSYRQAEDRKEKANVLLERATSFIIATIPTKIDFDTQKEAFALFETGAELGEPDAMANLASFYLKGYGVPQDYAKVREWLEKAAAKDYALAMNNLGVLYENGYGVPRDYGKAREWYEKAAAKDNALAMNNLGAIYESGHGVPQDYAKARDWYEKAAAQGYGDAKTALEQLPIHEAETAGRYDEALRLEEAFAAKLEAEETKSNGKPGEQTAGELQQVTWYALFAKDYMKALAVADRAHALFPDNTGIESKRAHALMFLGHDEEAKALYLAHKKEPVSGFISGEIHAMVETAIDRGWEQVIAEDFAELRKAGLTHPMMADIEKELGISR